MRTLQIMDRLSWHWIAVDGRTAHYGTGGDGRPLLFLHGWGLTDRTYAASLHHLVSAGLRVYAPALPGFGGTADLPADRRNLRGYGDWVAAFAEAAGIAGPVTLVGHSFGGGVAIRVAHDHPDLVARLVLVNSIGGSSWSNGRGVLRAIAERPLWDWGLHLQADLRPTREIARVLPVILRDAIPNVLLSPAAVWRVAHLARTADLTPELAELKARRLPVVIVWSKDDSVIGEAALLSLRTGLGEPEVVTVPGRHAWLLADPRRFGEVITNIIGLAEDTEGVA
ncbi:alpha/beta fold hydrolase [Amycolatopsis alkalitolerans]|uniref:Alpha/beta fold hydrolase n=1 Tax=Amycolatopsis alkalitolerans TaxID=2547244 RepID=A0A5C4M074_9PSEU|nr:alpha/beta fold hydrolase [Amycolatopsis alkalitolerans]TNC24179.1 alpha/beta fold hydrolase [Amycolatopsis alkalitolerans]